MNETCQDCGKELTEDDPGECMCPFQDEIYDEKVPISVCADCYHERKMDI